MRPLNQSLVDAATARELRTQYAFSITSRQLPGSSWNYTSPQALILFGDTFTPAVIKLADNKEGGDGKADPTKFQIECEPIEPFLSLVGRGLSFIFDISIYEVYFDVNGNPNADLIAEG